MLPRLSQTRSPRTAFDAHDRVEAGRANSIMWAGKTVGVMTGSGGAVLAKHIGWQATFMAMILPVWLIMLAPLLLRERSRAEDAQLAEEGKRLNLRELWRTLFYSNLIRDFIDEIIDGGDRNQGNFDDGAWVQEAINAVELSFHERRWVDLPLA